jgi:hypothetical protein
MMMNWSFHFAGTTFANKILGFYFTDLKYLGGMMTPRINLIGGIHSSD